MTMGFVITMSSCRNLSTLVWSACENGKYQLKLAKATEFHVVIYVAIFNPQLAESYINNSRLKGWSPKFVTLFKLRERLVIPY